VLRLSEEEVYLTDPEMLIEDIVDRLMDQGMTASDAVILIRGSRITPDEQSPATYLDRVLSPEFVLYLCELRMAYRDPDYQVRLNRARQRAFKRLQQEHPDEYRKLYEEEMEIEGFVRASRGEHDRGGKGPTIWRRENAIL
jgi:hypothetical protein